MSLSLKRLISIEKLMIHSASVILNQVILLTLSLKVLLAALVHWFFLCVPVLFSKPKNSCALSWQKMRKVVKGFETIVYVEAVLKPTHSSSSGNHYRPQDLAFFRQLR